MLHLRPSSLRSLRALFLALACCVSAIALPGVASAAGGTNTPACFAHLTGSDTPVADPQQIPAGSTSSIQLVCNGTDATVTDYFIVTPPAHGTYVLSGELAGTVLYTPGAGAPFADSFTFSAHDSDGNTYPDITVDLAVAVDLAPVCVGSSSATVPHGGSVIAPFTCTDAENNPFTVAIVSGPSQGTASISGSSVLYSASQGATLLDSVALQATEVGDPTVQSAIVVVSIAVTNETPVCAPVSTATFANAIVSFTLSCADGDGDPLAYSISTAPQHGSISLAGATATYVPAADFVGVDVLAFTASDATSSADPATVTISVLNQGSPLADIVPVVVAPLVPPAVLPPAVTPLADPQVNAPTNLKNGKVTLSLLCPKTRKKACIGVVHLSMLVHGKRVSLGSHKLTIKVGTNGVLKVAVPAATRRSLALAFAGKTVSVRVVFTTRGADGKVLSITKTVKLQIPRS